MKDEEVTLRLGDTVKFRDFTGLAQVVVIIARQVSNSDWPDGKNLTGLTPLSPAATDNRPAKFFDHRFLLR